MKSVIVRTVVVSVLVFCAAYLIFAAFTPKASAMPDPYMPIPGYWCQGGGGQFGGWGGFCDGATYPDGTHWHVANGMGIWLPAVCTFADGGTTPAPNGCRG